MSPLFETIKVVDGVPANLAYHTARLNRSRHDLFGSTDNIDLRDVLNGRLDCGKGVNRCRVVYQERIISVETTPYQKRRICSLSLVECNTLEYSYKFVDRSCIEALFKNIRTDDILLVKNGYITDASFANVVFDDGTKWITPSTPLLQGTARARLLENGAIVADEITIHNCRHFKRAALINAMIDLDDVQHIRIEDIM
jgi:4-amino-4-deoxychorismate lyase